jgi:DNA invertase Pin-like site-specific DNA recombinase
MGIRVPRSLERHHEHSNLRSGIHFERSRSRNAASRIARVLPAPGWQLEGEYIDGGISGMKNSRPELNRLMADAHKRLFDAVVVWRFDRFARSVSHLLRALETFGSLGIQFVSLSEQVDTSTPAGKMVFTVLGAVAELERSLIVERVRAGLRNARAKGKHLGRPRKLPDATKIKQLRAQGASWRMIGQELNVSPATALHTAARAV